MIKKEGQRPIFRAAAKRAAYEYLVSQLRSAQHSLRDNKFQLARLNNEQKELKANISGLHQVIQEFRK